MYRLMMFVLLVGCSLPELPGKIELVVSDDMKPVLAGSVSAGEPESKYAFVEHEDCDSVSADAHTQNEQQVIPIQVSEEVPGDTCWHVQLGDVWLDEVMDVVEVQDGSVLVVSKCHVPISENGETVALVVDIQTCVAKVDRTGKVLWQKEYGWVEHDVMLDIIAAHDSDQFMLAGYTHSSGSGLIDAWIMQITTDGELVWEEDYGTVNNDLARAIVADGDGGYIVVGNKNTAPDAGQTAWYFRIDSMGLVQWENPYEIVEGGTLVDVVALSDDEFVAVGNTPFMDGLNKKTILIAFTMDGEVLWQRRHGVVPYQVATGIAATKKNELLVSGYVRVLDGVMDDGFILRTDIFGGFASQTVYGGYLYDIFNSIEPATNGGFLISGLTRSYGVDGDMWLMKVGSDGQKQWQQVHGNEDFDSGLAVHQLSDGVIMLGGRGGLYRLDRHGQLCD